MAFQDLFYLGKVYNAARVVKFNRAPTSADRRYDVGTIWCDTDAGLAYICEKNANSYASWKTLGSSGLSWQAAVISKATAEAVATETEGYRYIAPAAGATWLENYIYEWKGGSWEQTTPAEGMALYIKDVDEVDVFDGATWDNLVSPVTTLAGLSDTTIAALADNDGFVYDSGTGKWLNQKITTDSISATAAIEFTKLEALTEGNVLVGDASNDPVALDASGDTKILIGNGTTIASFALTGDVAMTNGGLTTVTDLTMAAEAQGDVLYFDGTNWVVLAPVNDRFLRSNGAAANPSWETPTAAIASSLANGATLNDAGANDAILAFTTQTIGAPTLTVPDFASVSDTFAFVTLGQTLLNKTLTAPTVTGGTVDNITSFGIRSSGAAFDLQMATTEAISADKVISWNVGDTSRSITLGGNIALGGTLTTLAAWTQTGAHTIGITTTGGTTITLPTTGTLVTLAGAEELTSKVITSGILKTQVTLDQTTADYTFTWADPAAARAISIDDPLGDDKFAFLAAVQALTNKTINAASNTLTNININNMESETLPVAADASDPVYVSDGLLIAKVSNQAAAIDIFTADAPFDFIVLDAWSVDFTGTAGTWKLNNAAAGGGTDITNAVTVAGVANDIDRITTIDPAAWKIATGGGLSIVPDGGGTMDVQIFVRIARLT